MNIEAILKANATFAETGELGMRALDEPVISSEPFAVFHATMGDPNLDASLLQVAMASSVIIALARMHFPWPFVGLATQAPQCRDGIYRGSKYHRAVSGGAPHRHDRWRTADNYDDVSFRSELSLIRRIEVGFLAHRGLEPLAPSKLAGSQSIWSCSCDRRNIAKCYRVYTRSTCQSRRRRRHVIPWPKPNSCGKSLRGIPVCRTCRMPFSPVRSLTIRCRPSLRRQYETRDERSQSSTELIAGFAPGRYVRLLNSWVQAQILFKVRSTALLSLPEAAPTDERATKCQERFVNIGTLLGARAKDRKL
ncbi:transposase Tn3 family protein [Burkholderia lata]|nr:transposase Tn3 family protein [Burkholderia lata]